MKFTEELSSLKRRINNELIHHLSQRIVAEQKAADLLQQERDLEIASARAGNVVDLQDNCCVNCYVFKGINIPVTVVYSDDHLDKFSCKSCAVVYEVSA
ncbi:MAG: hypothetical protein V4628_18310 [Pseudomonadota bacterium]